MRNPSRQDSVGSRGTSIAGWVIICIYIILYYIYIYIIVIIIINIIINTIIIVISWNIYMVIKCYWYANIMAYMMLYVMIVINRLYIL